MNTSDIQSSKLFIDLSDSLSVHEHGEVAEHSEVEADVGGGHEEGAEVLRVCEVEESDGGRAV